MVSVAMLPESEKSDWLPDATSVFVVPGSIFVTAGHGQSAG